MENLPNSQIAFTGNETRVVFVFDKRHLNTHFTFFKKYLKSYEAITICTKLHVNYLDCPKSIFVEFFSKASF